MKEKFLQHKGFIQLPVMVLVGLLILSIALPAATSLVQKRQEIRKRATVRDCRNMCEPQGLEASCWPIPARPLNTYFCQSGHGSGSDRSICLIDRKEYDQTNCSPDMICRCCNIWFCDDSNKPAGCNACCAAPPPTFTPPPRATPTSPPSGNCSGCPWWQQEWTGPWCTNENQCRNSGMCNIKIESGEGYCSTSGDIKCYGCKGNPPPQPTATPTLSLCSEIAAGYDYHLCSNLTTTDSGCNNNICYFDIHVTSSRDCTGSTSYCRYYNRTSCGSNVCVDRPPEPMLLGDCLCATPTPTPTPTLRTCAEIGSGYDIKGCSSDGTSQPTFSCGSRDDPSRKGFCYYGLHVTSSRDCTGQTPFCRYYNRISCADPATGLCVQSACTVNGCTLTGPTVTPTHTSTPTPTSTPALVCTLDTCYGSCANCRRNCDHDCTRLTGEDAIRICGVGWSLGYQCCNYGGAPCSGGPTTTPRATSTPPSCSCPTGRPAKNRGNANCDDAINVIDFSLWLQQFHSSPSQTDSADFNCDTKVDGIDFEYWRRGK